LNDEQFAVMERFILYRGDDRANYTCELHKKISQQSLECEVWSKRLQTLRPQTRDFTPES